MRESLKQAVADLEYSIRTNIFMGSFMAEISRVSTDRVRIHTADSTSPIPMEIWGSGYPLNQQVIRYQLPMLAEGL